MPRGGGRPGGALDVWAAIREMELHYLEGAVTVVVCLDEQSPFASDAVIRRLEARAHDIDWLSRVEVRCLAGAPHLPATG